jgi:hypothetical protein
METISRRVYELHVLQFSMDRSAEDDTSATRMRHLSTQTEWNRTARIQEDNIKMHLTTRLHGAISQKALTSIPLRCESLKLKKKR